jgi:hypothetical protein
VIGNAEATYDSAMPTASPTTSRPSCRRWWRAAILLLVPIFFGLYAVRLGRDANWDLQNYHWYDPYALLNWRYDRDVAPALGMSFLAPLLYLPWFLIGTALPARALGFVIGAVQSINLLMLYGLALVMLPIERRLYREAVALMLAALGMGGGMSMGLLGTTFIDSIVSIGILGSLLAVVAWLPLLTAASHAQAARRAALAAVPAALAVAGKQTMGPFVIGLAAGFLVIEAPLPRRLWLLFWFGIGGTITAAIWLGPWLLQIWSMTGDPFYPAFAGYFSSPFGGEAWSYERWLPRSLAEALTYPFIIAANGRRAAEVAFTDFRFALAYALVPAALGLRLCGRAALRPPLPTGLPYLLVVMALGYVLWLAVFAYYRYAVTLELLAPLAVTLAVMALPLAWQVRSLVIALVVAALATTTRPADWGHLPWTARFVEVTVPPIADPQTAAVLLMGQPISYLVPSLPPAVAVLDVEMVWQGGNGQAWTRLIRERLASRPGALYAIMLAGQEPQMGQAAALFGLVFDAARCRPMPSNLPSAGLPAVNTLSFCPLERATVSGQ